MYCPRCAVQNLDDAKFCRGCGADIRLVSQALTGGTPAQIIKSRVDDIQRKEELKRKGRRRKPATLDHAFENIFKGIAFLAIFIIGLMTFRGAFWFTIWFIIPACKLIGEGVGEAMRARQEHQLSKLHPPALGDAQPDALAPANGFDIPPLASPETSELTPAPASVTEGTTRHLDAPVERGGRDA
ncbi:MAG TPA: zinc ribbon domain-containing protein [Pyrinomonadaceae bacterium]|nr:zinc ribbon domain-containing protein [Pyrinomonadaceae bacterium]